MTNDDLESLWPYVLTVLPEDLGVSALDCGALSRARKVRDAEGLLRIVLVYALSDLSLKDVAAWATAAQIAELTGPALHYRLEHAESWLSSLLAQVLAEEVAPAPNRGLRARVVDATVLTGPGAIGTEWRVHALADPQTGTLTAVDVTDASGGETLARHPLGPGDVVLGDRGYAHARGIAAAKARGAEVVVRVNPHAIRLCDPERTVIDVLSREPQVGLTGVTTWDVTIPIPPEKATRSHRSWPLEKAEDWVPARISAARTRDQSVIWVLTTLPAGVASACEVMDLYRVRWDVELLFKRLKSLLHLDALPVRRGGPTARSWIYARLLAAALAQRLAPGSGAFPPWGYRLR